ncbi:unnamed protein product, partial [Mycena citricolor]
DDPSQRSQVQFLVQPFYQQESCDQRSCDQNDGMMGTVMESDIISDKISDKIIWNQMIM